ncbi:class I SAM-dependent methyltransferase [Rivularia sp. UHCC 0363]|uniref:class I SAM-dependent methyltransferase n=1 Tax=Rivularia sp. UHCC 0363 TaxID=3110244 RepID=UPI002B1FC8CC|nr:class I SAM-dependent methyltransferase [Rivularia sp. UHCC 0363]MEA5597533.1 class I SAM-dependent methyltransferase [Rivularia sp. UHCC 0363]
MANYTYIGSELELFRHARNWKAYWSSLVRPFLGNEVLEVGAGIGSNTEIICQRKYKRWLCLEPDSVFASTLKISIENKLIPQYCEVKVGNLFDLSCEDKFDSIVYIDVIEHIENDNLEAKIAVKHLNKNGYLIILSPAHQWLFSEFDKSIGHYRRYNKKTLSSIIPHNLKCINLRYIDSIGLAASLSNKFILNRKRPAKNQILLWDRAMIPLSQKIDPLINYSLGKSILGIWQKI